MQKNEYVLIIVNKKGEKPDLYLVPDEEIDDEKTDILEACQGKMMQPNKKNQKLEKNMKNLWFLLSIWKNNIQKLKEPIREQIIHVYFVETLPEYSPN